MLHNKAYDDFKYALSALSEASEKGQSSPHTVYLALIGAAYSGIDVAQRSTILEHVGQHAERLAELAEDDFAEDALPGNNEEKSNHIRCVAAIRQNDVNLASLADELNMSSIAGIEASFLQSNACRIRETVRRCKTLLIALEPLLQHQGMPDAWLLSACGCVLLDKVDDIENLWQPAYLPESSRVCLTAPPSCSIGDVCHGVHAFRSAHRGARRLRNAWGHDAKTTGVHHASHPEVCHRNAQ